MRNGRVWATAPILVNRILGLPIEQALKDLVGKGARIEAVYKAGSPAKTGAGYRAKEEEMSDFININLDEVDDGSDPVPAGLRMVAVKSAQKKHKDGSEYPYIDVRLSPLDVEDKFLRRQLFLTLSFHPNALWNMKRFMKAAEISFGSQGFEIEDFLGKHLFVTVTHKPNDNDPSLVRAEVGPPYAKA